MDKKTIIYYGNILFPDKDAASHRVIGNAKALRELGYNVILVGCRKGEHRRLLETKEVFEGFDVYYFKEPESLKEWNQYLTGYQPLKKIVDKTSIVSAVILYNHPSISTKKILSFSHDLGIKVYADCTEWFSPSGFSMHTIIKKIDTWFRMRRVNKRLDGVIAISSYLQKYYDAYNCKTVCVPPLIDKKDHKWDVSSMKSETSEKVRICYVGNPGAGSKDKLSVIIEALNKIHEQNSGIDLQFTVVGMTGEDYTRVFGEDGSKYPFVQFKGKLPNTDALSIIKQSDFSIFIRDNNLVCSAGFPTKFSESIACGTPVLTNLTSDISRYLEDGENGFVLDPSTEKTLHDSLFRALNTSSGDRLRMKLFCKEYQAFDYHSFIEPFRGFINS